MSVRFFFVFLSCVFQTAFGQSNPFLKDVNGRPLYLHITYAAEGTPYLEDAYRPADITTTGNKTYTGIMVKLNLVENDVQFLGPDGSEMLATMPISKIKFHKTEKEGAANNLLVQSFSAINEPGAKVYAVLDSGKISLLKHLKIGFRDDRRYNEATVTRVFSPLHMYYAYRKGKEAKIEKSSSFLLNLFADKRKEVELFMKKRNGKLRTEEDLLAVFHFYNSLF